jgi:hypothetical protein
MAGSVNRPAVSFEDNDGGITEDAAIAWPRHEYGLSEGAAIPQLRQAWASGNVRGRTRDGWDYFEITEDGCFRRNGGERVYEAPYRCEVTGRFVHATRINAEDLRWQIEQQLGKPPASKVPKRKPDNKPETSNNGASLPRKPGIGCAVAGLVRAIGVPARGRLC